MRRAQTTIYRGADSAAMVSGLSSNRKSGVKAAAGFKFYALGDSSDGGAPVRDEREVTADILSF